MTQPPPKPTDDARWFDNLPKCPRCGRAANGYLMGSGNQRMGAYCTKCAEALLKKARKERSET